MTIDSLEIIKVILLNDGQYKNDAKVIKVYTYFNIISKRTFAIYYNEQILVESPFVRGPIELLFHNGLTELGKAFLKGV